MCFHQLSLAVSYSARGRHGCAQCSSAVTNSAGGRHGCVHQPSPTVQVADMAVCSVFINRGRHGCVLIVHQPSPTVQVEDMAVCSVFICRNRQCRWKTWLSSVFTNRHLPCRCRRHLYRRTVCRVEWSCGTAARTPRC